MNDLQLDSVKSRLKSVKSGFKKLQTIVFLLMIMQNKSTFTQNDDKMINLLQLFAVF